LLLHDLLPKVPRQDQQIVRPRLVNSVGVDDRDARAGQIPSLFVRAAIDSVIEKIRANAAIVKQRVAFAGRAITGDGFAGTLGVDQKIQQASLGFDDALAETCVNVELLKSGVDLALPKLGVIGVVTAAPSCRA